MRKENAGFFDKDAIMVGERFWSIFQLFNCTHIVVPHWSGTARYWWTITPPVLPQECKRRPKYAVSQPGRGD